MIRNTPDDPSLSPPVNLFYSLDEFGVYRPSVVVSHRSDEYDPSGFDALWAMQEDHFWYRGRHRFLLDAVDRFQRDVVTPRSAIDLGGGVGGWVNYLRRRRGSRFDTLALGDSSDTALSMAAAKLSPTVRRYHVDLMNLGWDAEWDCVFLLDVIEHLSDDIRALKEVAKALKPGGLLFVTTPALKQFWSYNDELAQHLRRYSKDDYSALARATGLELLDASYFMFLLSPLYWLARKRPGVRKMSTEMQREILMRSHRIPLAPINMLFSALFCAETPLGRWFKFPWGTSILGVFRRPVI